MNSDRDHYAFAPATSGDGLAGSRETQTSEDGDVPKAEGGNVDKIREILFGGQMRDYEKRFAHLEERLVKESGELREDTKRLLEALETFVKKEFEALGYRLQAEQKGRDESVQGVSRELRDTARTLEARLAQFDEQTTQAQRDLRQQLLDQSKSLSEEIRRKYDEASAVIERKVADLNHEKTDRASLSALFTEVALRLNNEFKIPGDH